MVSPSSIEFMPADLTQNMASCIAFRRDSFQINFGSDKHFDTEMGEGGVDYAARLIEFQQQYPYGVIHVYRDGEIIGQIDFRIEDLFTDKAFISMFYLVPTERGQGIGSLMHEYLINTLRERGCNGARILIQSSNERGVAFYRTHGWRYVKPDLNNAHIDTYQLNF
ncbi:GNAT family N-acetyltransferase [Leucothrix sargassi]|nr:GNAT family N-acetyltransferase [Leucothrix sargassi]